MARGESAKKHRVKCSMQVLELTKAGTSVDLEIFADGEKLGTLIIGRGSISWFGKGRTKGRRIGWSKFAEMMDIYCYGTRA
jgi:hypothetical protein